MLSPPTFGEPKKNSRVVSIPMRPDVAVRSPSARPSTDDLLAAAGSASWRGLFLARAAALFSILRCRTYSSGMKTSMVSAQLRKKDRRRIANFQRTIDGTF
ncbi:hypothetical protein SAY86_010462 [Trapa natans]|uniref:Uncharacterized protein n=1 Tax=Trapa natans TaxID=22666 RepID=A0AAN7LLP1_TRANT|nr:hypothetical protein SAY86_010462 [Trapa natans]